MPYDPRSSRPTPKAVPDEESAPVDALLGPSPAGAEDDLPVVAGSNGSTPGAASHPTPLPVPVRKAERAPSPILQLAPLLVALAVVLLWLIRRSRR